MMEEYIFLTASLTDVETEIYTNSNGMIIKTIMLNNPTIELIKATLKFDNVAFNFDIEANKNIIVSTPIMTKNIQVAGNGAAIHLTGLQIGVE